MNSTPGRRLDALAERWSGSPAGRVYERSARLELGMHSLALSAQHVLCAAPFLVAMSALSKLMGFGDVGHLLADVMGLNGDAQWELMDLFRVRQHETLRTALTGLLIAFAFITGVSASMQRTFERIWDVPHAGLHDRWRHLLWAVMTMLLFGFSLWINRATHRWTINTAEEMLLEALSTGCGALLYYWWTQRVLLLARVPWRALLPGSVLIGLGTAVLVAVVQLMAPSQVTEQVSDYGLVGAAFILSTILVAFSMVVLWGAYLGREWERRHGPDAIGTARHDA